MQLRRSRTAAALAVAVIAGTLGGAPTALAAPPAPDPATAADEAPDDAKGETAGLPSVWPRPQSLRAADGKVALGSRVVLVAPLGTDPYALKALREVLREAGVRDVDEVSAEGDVPAGATPVVRVGGESAARPGAGGAGLEKTLRALGASARGDLPQGGYRLAAGQAGGRPTVAMAGVGEDGLFHAVQTLRQLVRDGVVPGVVVRDWPGTPVRGLSEGFYGTPWTTEQRLGQLDFLGRTKQNHYLYAPGDDLFRQARWREPYPAGQRAAFRALAERARENHVTLAWAVAPGQAMCLASEDDVKALNRKIDAMWALGARAFQLQFQDVSYSEWHCGEDEAEFGSGPAAAARAQARVANAVAAHLAERHPGSRPLSLMPTEYYQKGATEYRRKLAAELEADVQVAWTGVGVVPRTITGRELAGTREVLGHPLVTLDNYPVNDYAQDRIFLGPYTGREPAVATGSAALIATAMEQLGRLPHPPVHLGGLRVEPEGLPADGVLAGRHGHARRGGPRDPRGGPGAGPQHRLLGAGRRRVGVPAAAAGQVLGDPGGRGAGGRAARHRGRRRRGAGRQGAARRLLGDAGDARAAGRRRVGAGRGGAALVGAAGAVRARR